jgi:hypothetical protein
LATAQPSASAPDDPSPSITAQPSASTTGQEAPEECGFPPGTALQFAGRSTYIELNVGESATYGDASKDPLGDDPADFYITRDPFKQGAHRGRLVCAIFVNISFVEITMYPEDVCDSLPCPRH